VLDFFGVAVRVRCGQVDLVESRHYLEVVLEREVAVGKGLGLDALGRVDEEHHPLAGSEAPGNFIAKIDVSRRVDQLQYVVLPLHADVLRLDGDAALAFDVHRVEVLSPHVAWIDCESQLQDAIRQRRLAMIDMADNREVTKYFGSDHTFHRAISDAVCDPERVPGTLGSSGGRVPRSVRVEGRMANIKSQIKRNLQNERRRISNKSVRSELKTRTKSALSAAETGSEDSAEQLRQAVKRIDKAAAEGVIHANQASRRKSRLVRRIAQVAAEVDTKA